MERLRSIKPDIKKRVQMTLGLDQDFAAAATSFYLLHSDDIVSARQFASDVVSKDLFFSKTQKPSKNELQTAALDIAVLGAVETSIILPKQKNEVEAFWSEIGTAIQGAEIELFQNGIKTESYPIISEGVFLNARRDHDEFRNKYGRRLNESDFGTDNIVVVYEKNGHLD